MPPSGMMAQWSGLDLPCWVNPLQPKCLAQTPAPKSDGSLTLWTKIGLGVILVLVFLIGIAGLVF